MTRPLSIALAGLMDTFLETLVGGLLAGVMYSLVAIGFVLIYKSSRIFNFAQGSMLLFAALTFVSLIERQMPFVLALAVTFAVMSSRLARARLAASRAFSRNAESSRNAQRSTKG